MSEPRAIGLLGGIGIVGPGSNARHLEVIDRVVERGPRGAIAGCTEIELLVGQEDVAVPYIRTTRLHALAAARWALAGPYPA